MRKIIIIFMMFIISSCSYYGKVNEKGEMIIDFENSTQENIIQNEITEELQDNIVEQIENPAKKEDVIEKQKNEEISKVVTTQFIQEKNE